MAETRFTPGPWRIPGANVFRVVAPDAPHSNKPVAKTSPYPWAIICDGDTESIDRGPEVAANMQLISAAPDLYEALERYRSVQRRMLEKWADGDDLVRNTLWQALHRCEQAADAALAKAEGKA